MSQKVSVIIPTYNRFNFLMEAITSVNKQTYPNIEIIIINDASTQPEYAQLHDNMIVSENQREMKIINLPVNMRLLHKVNAAQGATRNEGLRYATGEWIAFLDDDDTFLPHKIETQIKWLNHFGMLMSSSNMLIKNQTCLYTSNIYDEIMTLQHIEKRNLINTSTVILHKSIIEKTGYFVLGINEDYEYWKRVLKITNNLYINEPLTIYDKNHGYGVNYCI